MISYKGYTIYSSPDGDKWCCIVYFGNTRVHVTISYHNENDAVRAAELFVDSQESE